MGNLKLCRVSPPGKTGSRERKSGAGVPLLHNPSYPHLIHRLWTTQTEHLFGCMVHLTEHLFDFITQPTEHMYGLRIRVGGCDNTGRWVRQNNVYGKHKKSLTRLSKCALRGCQNTLTTFAITTRNHNQNVNRYHIRNVAHIV